MARESDLLKAIYERSAGLAGEFGSVVVGPGDDCAVVRVGGRELLLTVDQVVEHRHFSPGTAADLIARKAIARSISDLAAMAGTPAWALATGAIPEGYAQGDELCEALHRWARHWKTPLVGGDISSSPAGSPLVLTVTAGGEPGAGGPVLRSGARAGDEVWVTGRFGNSLASGRHLTFEPRLREAAWLSESLGRDLHAMIDVSDGLGRDAGRLAEASGVRIEIDMAAVPRHADATDAWRAIADGEDYELCFAVAPGRIDAGGGRAPAGLAPLTRIGRVLAGAGCIGSLGSAVRDISGAGWDHAA